MPDYDATAATCNEIDNTIADLLNQHANTAHLVTLIICFPLVRRALTRGHVTYQDADDPEFERQARYCLSALRRAYNLT